MDDAQAQATVDAALDAGWTFIDTAEAYLESEARLGRFLTGRRDRVFLATKVFPSEPYTARNLRASVEGSLRRLRTDRIDLLQLHGPEDWVRPLGPTPYEAVGEALEHLLAEGKVLNVGVCNLSIGRMAAIASKTRLFSTQNLLSLIDRGDAPDELHLPVESEILPWATTHSVNFFAWSPLSRGLLSETISTDRKFSPDDERHSLPRFQPGVFEHYVALAQRLSEWAVERGQTLARLAIAWPLSRPGVTAVLVGAKSPAHVEALLGVDSWHLAPDDHVELDAIVAELPANAKEAKMMSWDAFSEQSLDRLRQQRYGTAEGPRREAGVEGPGGRGA